MISTNNYIKCNECGGHLYYDSNRGERACSICGLVHSEREVDINNEGKSFFNKQEYIERKRTEIVSLFHSKVPRISLYGVKNNNLRRMFKLNFHMRSNESNDYPVINLLKIITELFQIPIYIKIEAFRTYKKAQRDDIIKGRTIENMLIACVIFVSRKYNRFLIVEEFASLFDRDNRKIIACIKTLAKALKLEYIPPDLPRIFLYCCTKLKIPQNVKKRWLRILKHIPGYISSGLNPVIFSGSLIYYLSKHTEDIEPITQVHIADILNITTTSIRNTYRKLEKHRK